MTNSSYDKTSVQSIYYYSLNLYTKSLQEVVELPEGVLNPKNRGDLGILIEKYFFKHVPTDNKEPDFNEVGLELKTTGVEEYKKVQKSGVQVKAKERLVLTNINYRTIGSETWETSKFLHKCNLMLVIFYKYDKQVASASQYFTEKPLLLLMEDKYIKLQEKDLAFIQDNAYRISDNDLAVIKKDWELIRQKIIDNKAHELSEGDTYYLGACRKGSGGDDEPLRKQSGDGEPAKSRAFAFKQGFMTKVLQGRTRNEVSLGIGENLSFEDLLTSKFQPYIGMTEDDISKELNYFTSSKSRRWLLAKRMLSKDGHHIEEFEKAGVLLKTVTLSKSGKSREDMSFPAFQMKDLLSQSWENSDFASQIESRFLFVVFKEDKHGKIRFEKVMYWNMPLDDRNEARRVWEDTQIRLKKNANDLPRRTESYVSHVRPHAKNKSDVDVSPQGETLIKRCFWLNASYISKVVS